MRQVDFGAFGARVMQLRRKANMTQTQFGAAIGINGAHVVSLWETGQRFPGFDSIRGIIEATNCDAHWLLTGVCYDDFQRLRSRPFPDASLP